MVRWNGPEALILNMSFIHGDATCLSAARYGSVRIPQKLIIDWKRTQHSLVNGDYTWSQTELTSLVD